MIGLEQKLPKTPRNAAGGFAPAKSFASKCALPAYKSALLTRFWAEAGLGQVQAVCQSSRP